MRKQLSAAARVADICGIIRLGVPPIRAKADEMLLDPPKNTRRTISPMFQNEDSRNNFMAHVSDDFVHEKTDWATSFWDRVSQQIASDCRWHYDSRREQRASQQQFHGDG
jgi:hypothetical protein